MASPRTSARMYDQELIRGRSQSVRAGPRCTVTGTHPHSRLSLSVQDSPSCQQQGAPTSAGWWGFPVPPQTLRHCAQRLQSRSGGLQASGGWGRRPQAGFQDGCSRHSAAHSHCQLSIQCHQFQLLTCGETHFLLWKGWLSGRDEIVLPTQWELGHQ